jgi:hypothetical protein
LALCAQRSCDKTGKRREKWPRRLPDCWAVAFNLTSFLKKDAITHLKSDLRFFLDDVLSLVILSAPARTK